MTELLSRDHTILERPVMQFRPFGVNERGEKIRDISGTIVKANVDYLEEYVAQSSGTEAGARAVRELCRLLNERLRDPAYHVAPKFLKNVWNSYSYEFVCYLREFCEQLSGDPQFHFNAGRVKHISPVTAILGRHLSVGQIYKLYPHFVRKYARGVIETESDLMADDRAIIRLRFTDLAHRQLDPYASRCAAMVCAAARGALMTLPERVHGLAPSTVTERTCMVNGDAWCEWEVTWTPAEATWSSRIIKRLFAASGRKRISI